MTSHHHDDTDSSGERAADSDDDTDELGGDAPEEGSVGDGGTTETGDSSGGPPSERRADADADGAAAASGGGTGDTGLGDSAGDGAESAGGLAWLGEAGAGSDAGSEHDEDVTAGGPVEAGAASDTAATTGGTDRVRSAAHTDSDVAWFVDPAPDTGLRFEDVAGLDEEKRLLRQTVLESVDRLASRMGELSVLFHGDTGVGKRRLAKALVGELCDGRYRYDYVHTLDRDPPEDGTVPTHVREVIEAAAVHQPLVLVLDCFDEHHRTGSAYQFREVLSACREADQDLFVVAVVDNDHVFNGVMQAYFRSFDLRVEVDRPDRDRRRRILRDELRRVRESGVARPAGVDLETVAVATDGLYVNDLREVVRRAAQRARTGGRARADADVAAGPDGTDHSRSADAPPALGQSHLLGAAERIESERLTNAAAREMVQDIDVSSVGFDDVGGLTDAKRQLQRLLEQPLAHADSYEAFDLPTNGGVLLHGPPGNGKTLLAKAVANDTGRTFVSVAGPELVNPFGTGTERRLRSIFEKARRNAPSVVFIDEFDSVGVQRGAFEGQKDETTNTLLTELDGLHANDDVVVVAATNRLETLDTALLRPGRFEHLVEVAPPDESARREVFAIHTADLPLAADVTLDWLVETTDELSGAGIAGLCNRAARRAIARCDPDGPADVTVTRADFQGAWESAAEARRHRERTREDRMFR